MTFPSGYFFACLGKYDEFIAVSAPDGGVTQAGLDVGDNDPITSGDDVVSDLEALIVIHLFEVADVEPEDGEAVVVGAGSRNAGCRIQEHLHVGDILFDFMHVRLSDIQQVDIRIQMEPFFLD